MIKIRMLNQNGIDEFQRYIQSLKEHAPIQCPDLNGRAYSTEYMPAVEIDEKKAFQTRLELGKYLYQCFENGGIRRENITNSTSLWTWLAYIYFSQVTDNLQHIGESALYVCSQDYTDYYRHLVWLPYNIYAMYGEENSKLFLDKEPFIGGDFAEQTVSRQYLISDPSLIKVLHDLYWDTKHNKAKKGATNRHKPGTLRRFIKFVDQIDLTFDIYNAPEKLIGLLPKEFDAWVNS